MTPVNQNNYINIKEDEKNSHLEQNHQMQEMITVVNNSKQQQTTWKTRPRASYNKIIR